jgi:predicted secreted protein
MPTPCRGADAYFTGSNTILLIGAALLTREAPNQTNYTLTTATPAVSIGGTTITLSTALTHEIQRGERLRFGSSIVQVDETAAIAATTITIKPALSAISIGATCTKQAWKLYESAASIDSSVDSESIEIRNMGACDWVSKLKTKLMATVSIDGNAVALAADSGRALVREAANSTLKRIAFGIIKPDGSWMQGKAWIKSKADKMAVDTAYTQSVSLEVDGEVTDSPATDLVLA